MSIESRPREGRPWEPTCGPEGPPALPRAADWKLNPKDTPEGTHAWKKGSRYFGLSVDAWKTLSTQPKLFAIAAARGKWKRSDGSFDAPSGSRPIVASVVYRERQEYVCEELGVAWDPLWRHAASSWEADRLAHRCERAGTTTLFVSPLEEGVACLHCGRTIKDKRSESHRSKRSEVDRSSRSNGEEVTEKRSEVHRFQARPQVYEGNEVGEQGSSALDPVPDVQVQSLVSKIAPRDFEREHACTHLAGSDCGVRLEALAQEHGRNFFAVARAFAGEGHRTAPGFEWTPLELHEVFADAS